jgi:cysteine desulfurase
MDLFASDLDQIARGYFDYNATTPLSAEVLRSMIPFMTTEWGNPSGGCARSRFSKDAIHVARAELADAIGADEDQICFTGTGSEASHLAWLSALKLFPLRRRIICSTVEHSANTKHAKSLEASGYEIDWIPVNSQGELDLDALESKLDEDVALVSVMAANNETGALHPIEKIGKLCQAAGVLFHTDAVQALGKVRLNLNQEPVDFASFSAHKIYGPKGVGALYMRQPRTVTPMIYGGGQEMGLRSGTENVAGIVGFGAAARMISIESHWDVDLPGIESLRDLMESQLKQRISGTVVFAESVERIKNTAFVSFAGVEAEALLIRLDSRGYCLSPGSACSTGNLEPSKTLVAMGIAREQALGAVRISLGKYTQEQDVCQLVETLVELVDWFRCQAI